MKPDLLFSPLGSGREQGLNHTEINNFSDDYHLWLVREGIQNSLDAAIEDTVIVSFRRLEVSRDLIPCIDQLATAFASARDYWQSDPATKAFAADGYRRATGENFCLLEMADSGTRGLTEERGWHGLVRAGGVSLQENEWAAGSYGIGKFAPFGGSRLRTVYYSTRTKDHWVAFQGVCEFATHIDTDGNKTQQTGYIGLRSGDDVDPVVNSDDIPEMFRRDEIGTSLFILEFRDRSSSWEENLMIPVVEHFWPAIHQGNLEVRIGDSIIDKEFLPGLMERFSVRDGFESHFYHGAALHGKAFEKALAGLGACKLALVPGESELPKKVCMTRKTGMMIENWTRLKSYRPFAGWFTCISDHGNTVLRKLEPPAHDRWAPKNKGEDGTAVLKTIRAWINECLAEFNPRDDQDAADIPELSKFLPDDEDDEIGISEDESHQRQESFGFRTPSAPLDVAAIKPSKSATGRATPEPSQEDGAEGGEGEGAGTVTPSGHPSEEKGGKSNERGGGESGNQKPRRVSRRLHARAIRTAESCYRLALRTEKPVSGALEIRAVGEDNKASVVTLLSAKNAETREEIDMNHVSLEPEEVLRLNLVLSEKENLALEVVCHGD